jgi:hypothetical protein
VTDATRRAGDENASSGQRPNDTKESQRRESGQRQGSRRGHIDAAGKSRQLARRHRDLLRPAAGTGMRDDARADRGSGTIRRRSHDPTGDVFSGPPLWPWRLEKECLASVDRKRLDHNDSLILGWLRLRDICEANHVIYISRWY